MKYSKAVQQAMRMHPGKALGSPIVQAEAQRIFNKKSGGRVAKRSMKRSGRKMMKRSAKKRSMKRRSGRKSMRRI